MATLGTAPKERNVSFTNFTGEKLSGILLDTGSPEVAILCHGYTDHKNGFHLPAIARALADKGWSSLRYRNAKHGYFLFAATLYQAAVRNNNCIQAVQATGIPPQTLYKQLNGVLASGLHCISALAFVGLTSMAMERARAASDMALIMKRCHSQSCAGVLSCPAKPYHTLNCNALPVLFESLISMQLMAA